MLNFAVPHIPQFTLIDIGICKACLPDTPVGETPSVCCHWSPDQMIWCCAYCGGETIDRQMSPWWIIKTSVLDWLGWSWWELKIALWLPLVARIPRRRV